MSLLFGEVKYLSSRVYDEEELEYYGSKYIIELDITSEVDNLQFGLLLFTYGNLATAFSNALLKEDNDLKVGEIIFRNKENDYIARYSKIQTLSIFNKCPVLVLTSLHLSYLKSSNDLSGAYMYHISSQNSELAIKADHLPQPTTISSFPAAVLTECITESRSCSVLVAFAESTAHVNVDLIAGPLAKIFLSSAFLKPLFNFENYSEKLKLYCSRICCSELDKYT